MAFKPFHFFRKRSKLFMAGLVLIAMFTFIGVVGSGQGIGSGLALRIKGWFGVVDNAVATVNGQGYDGRQLQLILAQRRHAAEFVMRVQSLGQERILVEAEFTTEDRSSEERFRKKREEVMKKNPDALKDLDTTPASFAYEAVAPFFQGLRLAEMYRQAGIDPARAGLQDPVQPEQILEFVHWQRKADELGIVMSANRVKQDLIRAGYSRIKEEDFSTAAQAMKPAVDPDAIIHAVGEEIRVMMARAVVLAPDRFSGSMLSTQVTPFDLWLAYVEIKTQLTVGVLPIQVNSKEFLDRVPPPSQTDLKAFFEEWKKQQPDPARDTPGFMVPKKYQIEFLYGNLRLEAGGKTDCRLYFEKAAATEDAKQLLRDALSLVPIPLPKVEPDRAVSTYKINKLSGRYRLPDDLQSVMIAGVELGDGSRYQLPIPAGPGPFNTGPGVERQAASQQVLNMAGALLQSPLSPLGVSSALRPMPRKATRTTPQAQSLELAAAVASAGQNISAALLQPALLGFYARLDYTEETKPFHEVLDSIRDEMIEDQCRTLIQRDLQQLKKDLDEYGRKCRPEFERWKRLKTSAEAGGKTVEDFDEKKYKPLFVRKEGDKEIKEPIGDYLKRYAAARGLTYEGMKEPRGPYDLFNEKDATPLGSILRPVYAESLPVSNRKPDEEIRAALIGGKGLYDATQVHAPSAMAHAGLKPWQYVLHWKVIETEARVPTFAEAEAQVLEAWKLKEARVLAEEQANIRAKQAKTDDGEKELRDTPGYLPEKLLGRYDLAGNMYRKSTVTYVDQPPDNLISDALDKLKNKGDTLIVANRPKSMYYLLVLKERNQPRAEDKTSVGLFDSAIVLPDPRFGFQVEDQPFSTWVQRERARDYLKNWGEYFRKHTEYDEKEAEKALDQLRSSMRN